MASRNRAACPDCGEEIMIQGRIELGMEVVCPHCEAELEVVETVPLELDWIYEDDDEYSEGEDEDEDW